MSLVTPTYTSRSTNELISCLTFILSKKLEVDPVKHTILENANSNKEIRRLLKLVINIMQFRDPNNWDASQKVVNCVERQLAHSLDAVQLLECVFWEIKDIITDVTSLHEPHAILKEFNCTYLMSIVSCM